MIRLNVALAGDKTSRRLLADALQDGLELVVVTEVSKLSELALTGTRPEVIVFSAASESDDGIRLARREYPDAALIAVLADTNRQRLRSALAEGVDGIVISDALERSLTATIKGVHAGQLVVPSELRASIVKPSLSTREKQVLGMVVMGFSNGEIARKLVLAESTIKSHLSSSFSKLGVRSRSEAAALILDSSSGFGTGILAISGEEESNGG